MTINNNAVRHNKNFSVCQGVSPGDRVLILAGNPNVGKSTLFNALTGQNQHTGNWGGKTVAAAFGTYFQSGTKYIIADVPGCYSLKSRSADEACASDTLCYTPSDGALVICDAGALERNLNLVIQVCEAMSDVTVCVNFVDESRKKGINIDFAALEKLLGVPVVKINARKKTGFENMIEKTDSKYHKSPFKVTYGKTVETAIRMIQKNLTQCSFCLSSRYIALRLLEDDTGIWEFINSNCKCTDIPDILSSCTKARSLLENNGITREKLDDIIAICISGAAKKIANAALNILPCSREKKENAADRILTGKLSGFAVMFLMLALIFYITLRGANYPSEMLSRMFNFLEPKLYNILLHIGINQSIVSMLVFGGFRVLGWVVAVMLPPMAIFFPMFTILEDVGYLPRVAFNLDRAFKSCKACGKQALTTCMGFGCNAVGVCGARIIDSPREQLIAILTNAFIPCNGRFPSLICIITVFFAVSGGIKAAFYLSLTVAFAVCMSLLASKFLSSTLLKGIPSSSVFELPAFRRPQIGKIIVRSVITRTLCVLCRAAVVAFPAGIVLWLLANIRVGGNTLISYAVSFLDPIGRLIGLDGTVLTAFILGLPANEIILPITLMIYSGDSVLMAENSYHAIYQILSGNGWTLATAFCAIVFFLMHWPCSTTIMTVKKETGSIRWAAMSVLIPTSFGIACCMLINALSHLFAIL